MSTQEDTTKLVMGSRSEEIVSCDGCKKELKVSQRHAFKGKKGNDIYFCDDCLKQVNEEFENESKDIRFKRALLWGLGASILAAVVWSAIAIISGYTVGYVAIAVGWLVGNAVIRGAAFKRSRKLQITAVVLTLVAILLAEFYTVEYTIARVIENNEGGQVSMIDLILVSFIDQSELGRTLRSSILEAMVTPVGVLIWLIGLYTAYRIPQPRKLA